MDIGPSSRHADSRVLKLETGTNSAGDPFAGAAYRGDILSDGGSWPGNRGMGLLSVEEQVSAQQPPRVLTEILNKQLMSKLLNIICGTRVH